jgi:small subunit ribosomal protein S16
MLMIRLARFGGKKKPSYRVVVIEKEKARNGRSVEVVGYYNPSTKPMTIKLDHEKIDHWKKVGAAPSPTVARLLRNNPVPVPVSEPAA